MANELKVIREIKVSSALFAGDEDGEGVAIYQHEDGIYLGAFPGPYIPLNGDQLDTLAAMLADVRGKKTLRVVSRLGASGGSLREQFER